MDRPHIGSDFDDFLAEQGLAEEVSAAALKRVIAYGPIAHGEPSVQLAQLGSLQVEIPAKALAALAEALDQIAKGRAFDLQGVPPEVATREAAALLNLPHPRLLQLLDDGAITSRMSNGRQRVRVVDLVAYRQAQAEASSAAMDELTRESERLNLGY